MSGYREKAGFDPNASAFDGRSKRPLNWVQRLGIASLFIGAAISLAYIAGGLGFAPKLIDSPMLGTAFVVMALPLINSRREAIPLSPATKRLRILIIGAALAICVLVAALVIVFKGA